MRLESMRPGTLALIAITVLLVIFEVLATVDNITGADHTTDIAATQHVLLGLFVAAVTAKTMSLEVRKKE